MGIHAVIIFFTLCLLICVMVFMQIVISIKSGVFEICNILKEDKQKLVPGILRYVIMLFKYLKKGMSKKTARGILRFVIMLFKYLKKGTSKKIVPGILKFVSMLFKYLKRT